jgi:eukaryotic-like serine/threonine-protein kinase
MIETLPRVGYRFIGTVDEEALGSEGKPAQAAGPPVEGFRSPLEFGVSGNVATMPKPSEGELRPLLVTGPPASARSEADAKIHSPRWRLGVISAALVALAAVGAWLYARSHRTKLLTEKDTIVVADFTNTTGDPVFDGTLRQALAVELEQSPFLNVISDRRVASTLRLMGRSPDARVTPDVAHEVCVRTGSKAIVLESIAQLGSRYLLNLESANCVNGETLGRSEREAADKDRVVGALGQAASDLRRKLGESLPSLRQFNQPLDQATTSSLEALQALSLSHQAMIDKGDEAAIVFLKRATELDPQFALAYAELGIRYYELGELSQGAENLKRAYELRHRVGEREKLEIVASYYHMATGQLNQAKNAYELWVQTYPRDAAAHGELGALLGDLGQYEKSAEETKEGIKLDAGGRGSYGNLINDYLCLNRLNEARATYEANSHELDNVQAHDLSYLLAFLRNDEAGMAREVAWAAGKPGAEDMLLANQASTEAFYGHLKRSLGFSQRAVQSAKLNDDKETAASWGATEALVEALVGNAAEARQQAAAAVKLASNRDIEATVAMAFAQSGDVARAKKLSDDLERRLPLGTLVSLVYIPAVRAEVDIQQGRPAEAITELEAEAPYDLSTPQGLLPLYPVYVRAEGYLRAGRGADAVAEFQRILDHPGIVVNTPVWALARLDVARAYALEAHQAQGDQAHGLKQKARAAYGDFLTLWKDADPDVPVLKQAKAEYSKLDKNSDR